MKKFEISKVSMLKSLSAVVAPCGFNVVKISENEALTLLSRSEQAVKKSFKETLVANGISNYTPLCENEEYNGYVAIWFGDHIKAYHLIGWLSMVKKSDTAKWDFANERYKAALRKGQLMEAHTEWRNAYNSVCYGEFREVIPVCGWYKNRLLEEAKIGERLRQALLTDGIIELSDEEKTEFTKFTQSFLGKNFLKEVA